MFIFVSIYFNVLSKQHYNMYKTDLYWSQSVSSTYTYLYTFLLWYGAYIIFVSYSLEIL